MVESVRMEKKGEVFPGKINSSFPEKDAEVWYGEQADVLGNKAAL